MPSAAQQQFLATYGPLAQDVAGATGLDPSVVLGQIAQETGWGQHLPGNGTNLFGISPGGNDKPASYPDIPTAAQAYVDLMRSPAYAAAAAVKDPTQQAAVISQSGYNRNPQYAPSVASNAATIRQMMAQSAQSGPAADPGFETRWGLRPPANDQAAQSPSDADFAKRWGITPPAAPSATPVAPAPVAPATAPAAPQPDYTGWDTWAPSPKPASPDGNPLSYQSISNALAPTPDTTYGSLIPFARDNTTGALRPALPTSLRDLAQGAVDLLHGPVSGTVTPKATMALASVAGQLTPSPAAGTGAAIMANGARAADVPNSLTAQPAAAAAPNPLSTTTIPTIPPAPSFVPPGSQVPPLQRILELIRADDSVAENRPSFIPPDAAQPPNPLSTPSPRLVPGAAEPQNPLQAPLPPAAPAAARAAPPVAAPAAAPPAARAVTPTSQEAAELAAIPEKIPPAPLLPPLSQDAAAARADQLVKHFSTRQGEGAATDLVPGYVPTLAQKYNDPGLATLERGMQSVNPGPFAMRAERNQAAIRNFTADLTGAPADIAAAEAQREAATAPLRDAAFANKMDVDATPVSARIDSILASPDGKRTAVRKTLGDVQAQLHNADDNLETDPEMLYGVRKHINDLLSPVAQRDNPELQRAASQLIDVKGALDDVIEAGAPGFKDYIAAYANQSAPIDSMRYLQSLNLTDSAGNVTLASVDRAIKSITKQQAAPGVQKASAVSPDQMNALQTLRNTLRTQAASAGGKVLGSNTFQYLATNSRVAGVAGNPLVSLGLSGAGAMAGGPLGAMAGAGLRMAGAHVASNAEDMVQRATTERLLNLSGKGDGVFRPAPTGPMWNGGQIPTMIVRPGAPKP